MKILQMIPKGKSYSILFNPRLNKGTAFSKSERKKLGLTGLLPDEVETMDQQIIRVQEQLENFNKSIDKYVYLTGLHDINETLFYRTIISDPAKYLPLIYTPTVGEACQKLGHIARRPRGIFVSIKNKNKIEELLNNWPVKDVKFTVVTDGERILGLGDLGIFGIGIPIGKLMLYTACGGVPPQYTLPIVLDAGTNNESLLKDPLYPGLKQKRVTGKEYDDFIEKFIKAITKVFPEICIQWEDFAGVNAIRILEKYRDRICTFNDDMQGTAAIALAGFLSASRLMNKPFKEQRFLFLGAGAAALGIANLIVKKLTEEGLDKDEAHKRCWMFDIKGLLVKSRTDLSEHQKSFAHEHEPSDNFAETILQIKPTAILGVSTAAGAFNRQVIENMSLINERPVIFPYSNPTSNSECTAEEAYQWSKGKAIFASGSPFAPVIFEGKTFIPGQGNNVFIFPALGLAVYALKARRITDDLLITAAESVSSQVTQDNFDNGLIYPKVSNIREVSLNAAVGIAERIFKEGLAGITKPSDLRKYIKSKMYEPVYRDIQ